MRIIKSANLASSLFFLSRIIHFSASILSSSQTGLLTCCFPSTPWDFVPLCVAWGSTTSLSTPLPNGCQNPSQPAALCLGFTSLQNVFWFPVSSYLPMQSVYLLWVTAICMKLSWGIGTFFFNLLWHLPQSLHIMSV